MDYYWQPSPATAIKRESTSSNMADKSGPPRGEDPMPSTSDFVKKLYKMLEDPSFQSVVCWGPQGDCFVVKDMNEFTKSILPRMFKHSNFASFVRQLNKYDFHKVKNTDDNQYGEHSWTFRHPDFHADRRDALENIKRKVPAQRKSTGPSSSSIPHSYPSSGRSPSPASYQQLHAEIQRLREEGDDLKGRIRSLERNYESVLVEMVGFQRGMAQQDGLMQSLIAYFLGSESGKIRGGASASHPNPNPNPTTPSAAGPGPGPGPSLSPAQQLQQHLAAQQQRQPGSLSLGTISDHNPFLPQHAMQRLVGQTGQQPGPPPQDVGRATLMQMNELSRRADRLMKQQGQPGPSQDGRAWPPTSFPPRDGQGEGSNPHRLSRAEALEQIRDLQRERVAQGGWAAAPMPQVYPMSSRAEGPEHSSQDQDRSGGMGMEGEVRGRSRERQRKRSEGTVRGGEYQPRQQMQPQIPSSSLELNANSSGPPPPPPQPGEQQPQPQTPMTMGDWAQMMSSQPFGYQAPVGGSEDPSGTAAFDQDHEGLQVYTVGHLLPRGHAMDTDDKLGNWSFDPSVLEGSASRSSQSQGQDGYSKQDVDNNDDEEVVRPTPGNPSSPVTEVTTPGVVAAAAVGSGSQKLRVRRSTFVPGWAVPPRVLLVDDDAVSRKLSTKFLKVFGCTTDVAVDGISAVNKMNLEKYDLVLMDIVMPKLDGVSATNLIRKFDQGTPIISMTSNSKPNEIMTYYSSGMNDILPKPFTKEGLLDMLEKHLMHLKVISQMARIQSGVGIPPLSDANFEQAVASGASAQRQTVVAGSSNLGQTYPVNFFPPATQEDDGRINPLAGMGLTDEQYGMILQNILSGEGLMSGMDEGYPGGMPANGGQQPGMMNSGMSIGIALGEKRALDDGEDREGLKRSRFEVIE